MKHLFTIANDERKEFPVTIDSILHNGAESIADGVRIPAGETGNGTCLIISWPNNDSRTRYTGMEIDNEFTIKIVGRDGLSALPTLYVEKYKDGVMYAQIRPSNEQINDDEGEPFYREYNVKQIVTPNDAQEGYDYRFVLLFNNAATTEDVEVTIEYSIIKGDNIRVAYPVYKDDVAMNYEQESGQKFFRKKLSGKISLIADDYDFVMAGAFDAINIVRIRAYKSNGKFSEYYTGKFMRTDCTINEDDKSINVQPETIDQYVNALDGVDNEYDLIKLRPATSPIIVRKRPLVQFYVPGDNVVSCFLSGSHWEEDADVVDDEDMLVNKYRFALKDRLKEVQITSEDLPGANGLYVGALPEGQTQEQYDWNLYPEEGVGYYLNLRKYTDTEEGDEPQIVYRFIAALYRASDDVVVATYDIYNYYDDPHENEEFVMGGFGYSVNADMKTYHAYARLLTDVEEIRGHSTSPLDEDDIVENSRNYRRAIGYGLKSVYINNRYSDEPTEYGLADNGKYFVPPYIAGTKLYPLAQSRWKYASLWYAQNTSDPQVEEEGRKAYVLKDAHPIASIISAFLKEIAPEIKHEATPEYSQFLYGDSNPIYGRKFTLFVTQKSNILSGEYDEPAKKAPAMFQDFINMLKYAYNLYWYIEDGKFHVEHVEYFRNGGSYSRTAVVGTDLTALENVRNGKKLAFATSEYTFDKPNMPARYEYEWMDDCQDVFDGNAIEVRSNYVQKNKTEKVSVSNFTPDVDMMLLNPGAFNKDGFALLAAVEANAIANPQKNTYSMPSEGTGNTEALPRYAILDTMRGRNVTLRMHVEGSTAPFILRFYAGDTMLQQLYNFAHTTNDDYEVAISIPDTATEMAFFVVGLPASQILLKFWVWGAFSADIYELPFVEIHFNDADLNVQNGYASMAYLQGAFLAYDISAPHLIINGEQVTAGSVARNKKQTLTYPVGESEPSTIDLVKTYLGNGQVEMHSVNLSSLTTKTTLKYDNE